MSTAPAITAPPVLGSILMCLALPNPFAISITMLGGMPKILSNVVGVFLQDCIVRHAAFG